MLNDSLDILAKVKPGSPFAQENLRIYAMLHVRPVLCELFLYGIYSSVNIYLIFWFEPAHTFLL